MDNKSRNSFLHAFLNLCRRIATAPPNIEFIVEDEDSGIVGKNHEFMGKCSINLRSISGDDFTGIGKFKLFHGRVRVKLQNDKGFSDMKEATYLLQCNGCMMLSNRGLTTG